MTGVAGYLATVKRSGTPTAFSSEAMALDGSTVSNRYQISDAVKEIWDRDVVPNFRGGPSSAASTIGEANIVARDYLFGKVTFGTTVPVPVVVDGSFMPMQTIAGANDYTLEMSADILDNTDFDSTGQRSKQIGLLDVSLTVTRWEPVVIDNFFFNALNSQAPLVAEVQPGGAASSGPIARGWFVPETDNRSADVASLESGDISLQLDGDPRSDFNWSDR